MKLVRAIILVISIIFLFIGISNVTTMGNLGGFMATIIGTVLLIIFAGFNKIKTYVKSTILGKVIFTIVIIFTLFVVVVEGLIISSEAKSFDGPCDAIMILGSGVYGEEVSPNLQYRLDKAIEYLEKYPDTLVIVSGGQGPGETIPEAEAMKRYLVRNGIDEQTIIKEEKSKNTLQNFTFSKEILDKMFENKEYKLVYVTSNFHVFRAGQIAKKQGMQAHGIAAKDVWYLSVTNHLREFLSVTNMWLGVFK